ncbi:MAG TPA: ABC transporter substrate-binding protein [Thermodesulfobacteriota bacterium]|nr:ABC transporter substrate-binding protein [Thermodesulfobacteriota bacterium]
MKIHSLNILRLILPMIFLSVSSVPAATHPATGVVENLHTTLLTVMKEGEKIGYRERHDRLAPVIVASFDLPFIAKTVVGRYWDTFDSAQKAKFVEAFSRLSIATYTANFATYSGERFRAVSEKDLGSGQIEVKSQLIKADGGEVSLNYILHWGDNRWRIINVIANGVSDLALKRADYTSFLKSKGFEALLFKVNEKITQYSNKTAD